MKKNSLLIILSIVFCFIIFSNIGISNNLEENVTTNPEYIQQSKTNNITPDYPIDEEFTYKGDIDLNIISNLDENSYYNDENYFDDDQPILNDYEDFDLTNEVVYIVYDENDNKIFERNSVTVGDIIIDKNFNKFEIFEVDVRNHIAYAKFIEKLQKPTIKEETIQQINNSFVEKKIGLYMTHNDESYVTGDGYSSIYGEGGIHDIASNLSDCLLKLGIQTYFDETLHIPHDNYAYSRSKNTANSLLENNLNAIFDIHRDGASRKTYVTNYNGEEKCMVRIVVGQANPNKDVNLQFAMYLMSVAEDICPWLFLDIYYAHGHYNQNLSSKAVLFEMGSHLVEKDLVEKTVPYLAKVINTTLFNTTVNETEDELTINNSVATTPNTVDKVLENKQSNSGVIYVLITLACIVLIVGFAIGYYKKIKSNINKKPEILR